MSIYKRVERLENIVKEKQLDSKIWFFETHEEFEQAQKDGKIGENDICIIDLWRSETNKTTSENDKQAPLNRN